jgi:outer membrane protein assembly factor BamB
VSVSASRFNVRRLAMVGDTFTASVTASWSPTTNLQTCKIYLQARDTGTLFGPAITVAASAGANVRFDLPVRSDASAGEYSGTIQLRACEDEACASVFARASTGVPYRVRLQPAPDWQTHQAGAAHRGYVGMLLDPQKFAKAWEWSRPPGTEPIGGINPVTTANGMVYVSDDVYFGTASLRALDESTGAEVWTRSFGSVPALNPPAVSGRRVHAAVTGHEATSLWTFDARTGAFIRSVPFEGQWPHLLAPVVHQGAVYTGGGGYGGTLYSFSLGTGARNWAATSGDDDMFVPAVDDSFVYHYDGTGLLKLDRASGAVLARIADPFGPLTTGYSYHAAPMIGSSNNVIAFSGGAFSGRAGANTEQFGQRVLTNFLLGSNVVGWTSANAYLTAPALANGVVYAARNAPMSLDAIDEATGSVLWSWRPPAGSGDAGFHRNVVATRNLVFVSTDANVYAIDIDKRAHVWRYPAAGMLALSGGRTLYIATGATASNGKLVAIRLK